MDIKLLTYCIGDFDFLLFNLKFYSVFITFEMGGKIKYERKTGDQKEDECSVNIDK